MGIAVMNYRRLWFKLHEQIMIKAHETDDAAQEDALKQVALLMQQMVSKEAERVAKGLDTN